MVKVRDTAQRRREAGIVVLRSMRVRSFRVVLRPCTARYSTVARKLVSSERFCRPASCVILSFNGLSPRISSFGCKALGDTRPVPVSNMFEEIKGNRVDYVLNVRVPGRSLSSSPSGGPAEPGAFVLDSFNFVTYHVIWQVCAPPEMFTLMPSPFCLCPALGLLTRVV